MNVDLTPAEAVKVAAALRDTEKTHQEMKGNATDDKKEAKLGDVIIRYTKRS